ncbi:zinc finger protein 2 [Xenopus laevis]|uniref:C2H2-type domain-containing protein n=2 Tax=Xenopus laevis TaxID=8355 RepID=A0A974H8N3_XENLA|nr:zinc finger protein 2 [Xenopus laevis]OCT68942.1 hypothetical protein XELAEV_18040250mg [Xenopus laevis]
MPVARSLGLARAVPFGASSPSNPTVTSGQNLVAFGFYPEARNAKQEVVKAIAICHRQVKILESQLMKISEEPADSEIKDMEKIQLNEQILFLTLKIVSLLTGEDYIVVRQSADDAKHRCKVCMVNGFCKHHTPPLDHSTGKERDKEILEIISNIIFLLTEEVTVRCEDVSVYFSKEEWEYLSCNKTLYKEVMQPNSPPLCLLDWENNLDSQDNLKAEYGWDDVPCQGEDMAEEDYKVETLLNSAFPPVELNLANSASHSAYKKSVSYEEGTQRSPNIVVLAFTENMQITNAAIDKACSLNTPLSEIKGKENGKMVTNKSISASPLKKHTKATYICGLCQKLFPCNRDLIRHQKYHTGEKPFSCSVCGKCYGDNTLLVRHQRIHTADRLFPCPECGKFFVDRSQLLIHQTSHTGEKRYSCAECGKWFYYASALTKHQRIHTGEKPYSCSFCGKRFNDNSILTRHERIHTGEKPFACTVCGKRYTRRSHLSEHQRSHTGETPFICSECGICFGRQSHLKAHFRIHTSQAPLS